MAKGGPDEVAIAKRMLELLDELEHYKSREDRVTKLVLDNSASWEELYKKLEVVNELFLRAKALMYQSGGTPIENSLNPIDAWLYDAERAAAAGKGEAS